MASIVATLTVGATILTGGPAHADSSTAATVQTGPWHFINVNSGKCLTVANASTVNNAGAVQYACDYAYPHNEDWTFDILYNRLINAHSGKCLTVVGNSMENNAGVVQFTCTSPVPDSQRWLLDDLTGSSQFYHLVNFNSKRCLTIAGASLADNAAALQFSCLGDATQMQWYRYY